MRLLSRIVPPEPVPKPATMPPYPQPDFLPKPAQSLDPREGGAGRSFFWTGQKNETLSPLDFKVIQAGDTQDQQCADILRKDF